MVIRWTSFSVEVNHHKMRLLFLFFAMACILAAVLGAPGKDLKEVKKEAARKKACMQSCDAIQYKPICASKEGIKPMSFGSLCVMNNYNCEKGESLSKISDGECPGGGGVRLS